MDLLSYRKARSLTQSGFAEALTALGYPATQGLISQWEHGLTRVPAERCRDIERATDGAVTRYDLRPDVFGPAPEQGDQAEAA